ncbi:hypothetical protein F1880_008466 [Penicillium rolfsii]|nr:hypothetical protein F1880_008466 [Penicillium rolfsii]
MDSKSAMKLGRPFMIATSYDMPNLPSDTLEAAASSGFMFAPIRRNTTWLGYNRHTVQLYIRIRTAYTAFFDLDVLLPEGRDLWANPEAQNSSAKILNTYAQSLYQWIDGAPESLKLKRQHNGLPLSTDFTSILIEPFIPAWLQRQRLLLEHTYHHLDLAKNSIEMAILVFGHFGAKFSVAANAAEIARDLSVKIEVLARSSDLESSMTNIPQGFSSSPSVPVAQAPPSQQFFDVPDFTLFDRPVNIDFWNSLDTLWPDLGNPSRFQAGI